MIPSIRSTDDELKLLTEYCLKNHIATWHTPPHTSKIVILLFSIYLRSSFAMSHFTGNEWVSIYDFDMLRQVFEIILYLFLSK